MRIRALVSSAAAATLLTLAPAAMASEWNVSDEATFYIDATVTHAATPDLINMSVDCQIGDPLSREAIRAKIRDNLGKLTSAAGDGAKIRRSGAPTLYAFTNYDPTTGEPVKSSEATFSGNFGYTIQKIDADSATTLADAVESMGCTYTWDPRLVFTGKYAREHRAELMEQINEKKGIYEEILGIKLTQVSSVSFSTYVDSTFGGFYGSSPYDAESNSVTATTTMSVTFDLPKASKKK